MNPGLDWQPQATLAVLRQRAALLAQVRAFFNKRGLLEVETPVLAHAGAADAQLSQFLVNDAVHGPLYLQTSPEYAMKRLLLAGIGSIFQITKAFRQGEVGRRHNPEFTLVEWYALGYTHEQLIEETCALIQELVPRLAREARSVSYRDAFLSTIGIDPLKDPTETLQKKAHTHIPSAKNLLLSDRNELLDLLMSQAVAPTFTDESLTVITDYPASQAALARINSRGLADRFEIYCGSLELANGFYEAIDSAEYSHRFHREALIRQDRGLPPIPTDVRLLAALAEHPLPECAGVALGFDRVVMLASCVDHIKETLAFTIDRA